MGFSEWFTGTKCAECGRKIEGARFDRTVMGTKVWVCFACNEKAKEERRLDTESNIAGAVERGQENATAEQKRDAEIAAAIQPRSDADIAEAMSKILLGKYAAFTKAVHDTVGGAGLNHEAAFMYFLAVASYPVRRLLRLQLDNARLDRIEETAGRYALSFMRCTAIHPMLIPRSPSDKRCFQPWLKGIGSCPVSINGTLSIS